jgi:RNA polymerase sigma factor (sigma-70 family)
MQDAADMELLRQYVQRNSEDAFAALVARHVNLVYSAALRKTGNPHAAEEITQAVFIILAKKADGLRPGTILPGWLYQTARLTAAGFLRGEIRRSRREQEAYMQSTANETESDVWRQIVPLLEDAMGRLGEKDRSAIVLRFFEGKSFSEIGVAFGASENAAKKRVNYALEKLRRHFSKRGVVSTAAILATALSVNSIQAAPSVLAASISAVAVTKGATAGASTLTLIKGTLKLMAWAKMKIAFVASATALLAVTAATVVVSHSSLSESAKSDRQTLPTGPVKPMAGFGYKHGIIQSSEGSLWAWGDERLGWPVLGLPGTNYTATLRRIGHETNWVSLAVGGSHSLAIKSDGTLWAWGGNVNYQLGDGSRTTRPTPIHSIPGNDWKQAAAGGASSYALKKDGTLWAWGNNWAGNLGIGTVKETTNAVQVGVGTNWVKIWAQGIQTVGLQSDGSLWFWGTFTGSTDDDAKLLVPTRISPDTNWVDVSFAYFTVFAIKSDGTLWSWGREANVYTGAPDSSQNETPRQVGTNADWQACAPTSGGFYLPLVKKDGSLWALDASEHREIKPTYGPVKLVQLDPIKDMVALASGADSIGLALTSGGEVWTWGEVLGEQPVGDFWGPDHELLHPTPKIITKPWRLSIIDPAGPSGK